MIDDVTVRAQLKDELSRPAKKLEDQLERTGRAADKMASPRRNRELAKQDRLYQQLTRNVRKLDRGLTGMSRRFGDFFGRQLRRAALTVGALTASVGFFGLRSASEFEQTQIAFEGLLGSVQKGQRLFEDLREFNKRSPFELGDITGAARQLLGFQFQESQILPLVRSAADAASALGVGAAGLDRIILNLGQVQATGKVTGRELRDFATVGFPGYGIVADILGTTRDEIKALGDDAEVSADQFITAVMGMQGPLQQFEGMAERQQKSLWGLWSNVKDIFQTQLADPTTGAFVPLLDKLRPMLDLDSGTIPLLLDQAVRQLGPPIVDLLGMIVDLGVEALPVLQPLLAALITGLGTLANEITPGIRELVPVADELAASFGDFFEVLAPQMPALVDATVALVGVLPDFVRHLGSLARLVTPIANVVSSLLEIDGVSSVVGGVLVALLGYRALSSVTRTVIGFAGALRGLAGAQAAVAATTVAGGVAGGVGGGGWGPVMVGGGGRAPRPKGVPTMWGRAGGFLKSIGRSAAAFIGLDMVLDNWDPSSRNGIGDDLKLIGGSALTAGAVSKSPLATLFTASVATGLTGAQRLMGATGSGGEAAVPSAVAAAQARGVQMQRIDVGGITVNAPNANPKEVAREVARQLDSTLDRRIRRFEDERDRRQ